MTNFLKAPSTGAGSTTSFLRADGTFAAVPAATALVQGLVKLTGDLAGTADTPLLAATGVSAGTYGSSTLTPVLVVDAKGRVTSASTVATSGGSGGFANPMTTIGDLIAGGTSGSPGRLGGPTSATKQFLTSTGTGSAAQAPAWGGIATTDVSGLTAAILAAQSSVVGVNTQTASYTPVLADAGKLVVGNSASAITFTIPLNATVAYPVGTVIPLANIGAGALTIAGTGGVTINSPAGLRITTQYAQAALVKIGTDSWLLSGNTAV